MAPQDQCQEATKMCPWLLLGMGLPMCISYCVRIRPLSNLELDAKRANRLTGTEGEFRLWKYFLNKAKPVDSSWKEVSLHHNCYRSHVRYHLSNLSLGFYELHHRKTVGLWTGLTFSRYLTRIRGTSWLKAQLTVLCGTASVEWKTNPCLPLTWARN